MKDLINLNNEFIFKNFNGKLIGQLFSKLENMHEYDMVCSDCNHDSPPCNLFNNKKKLNNFPDSRISYKLNNYGYRCDDFNNIDSQNNFLFSGCSNTFGTGIPYNGSWAYQLNKNLGGEKFFNLAINGSSSKLLIYELYEYIQLFGKPKAIFILFPGIDRFNNFIPVRRGIYKHEISTFLYTNKLDSELSMIMNFYFFFYDFINLIKIFESYCNNLNIKLFWSTWNSDLHKAITNINTVKNYFSIVENNGEILFDIMQKEYLIPKELNNEYWTKSRDIHPSIMDHHFYYKVFEKEYKKTI